MKKEGFTLVELLAVIAILAILVILALPNVIGLYNSAKQESFLTEVKSLANTAEKQYMSNQIKGDNNRIFSSDGNKLETTGRELEYCIILGNDGKIKDLKVSDGTWLATLPTGKEVADLTKDNLEEGSLNGYNCGGSTTGAPENFSNDSWDTIINAVKKGNTDNYEIGDEKEIDMGDYGTHKLRIANMSTPEECSTEGFSQTACGFVLEFADVITVHAMNDTLTNSGGWPSTTMRTFVNSDIYNALPSELQNGIINTTVVSGHGKNDTTNFTSTDKLYLLAPAEIWGDVSEWGWVNNYDEDKDLTRQLDYYKKEEVSTKIYDKAVKKLGITVKDWYLRSASSYSGSYYFRVYINGSYYYQGAITTEYGVSPAFRIG